MIKLIYHLTLYCQGTNLMDDLTQAEQNMQFVEFNKDSNRIIQLCFIMISKKIERYMKDWDDTNTFNSFMQKIEYVNKALPIVVNNKMNDTMYQTFYTAVERYLNDWDNANSFNSKISAIEQVLKNSTSNHFLDKKEIFICISKNELLDSVEFFKNEKTLFQTLLSNWEERRLKDWDNVSTYNSHIMRLNKCQEVLDKLNKKQWHFIVHESLLAQLGLVYEHNEEGKKIPIKISAPSQDKKEAKQIIKNSRKKKDVIAEEKTNDEPVRVEKKLGFFKKLIIALQFLFGKDVKSLLKEDKVTHVLDTTEENTAISVNSKEKMITSLQYLIEQKTLNDTNQQLMLDIIDIVKKMPINEKQNIAEFVEIKNTCLSILPNLVSIFNSTQNKDNINDNGKNAHQFLEDSLISVKQYLEDEAKNFQTVELNSIEVYSSFVQNKFKKASM